jgi:hypothetical protein
MIQIEVVTAELGGDEPRVGYVQPCGCIEWPTYRSATSASNGTLYMAYVDTSACELGHES